MVVEKCTMGTSLLRGILVGLIVVEALENEVVEEDKCIYGKIKAHWVYIWKSLRCG